MNNLSEKLQEIIAKEEKKNSHDKQFEKLDQFVDEMKKSGLIKKPDYTLPMVDTIGKTYYSSINRKEIFK